MAEQKPESDAYEFSFTPGERRVFTPKEKISVSQWAERHRAITRGPMPGQWSNDRTPYLTGPMNAFSTPSVRKIFMCFAPQTGKTQAAFNCLCYAIDQDPDAAMYVMPDEQRAKRISKRQIIPMLQGSPRIHSLLGGDGDVSTLAVSFINGMDLMLAWATSAAALASESVRYMFFDEIDKYPPISLDLGDMRTNAYPHTKKLMYYTTPEEEGKPISKLMSEEADITYHYEPCCPFCGEYQKMEFDFIKWPKDIRDPRKIERRKLARYVCIHCGNGWDDGHRDLAVRKAVHRPDSWYGWVPDAEDMLTDRPSAVGFHLPSWHSPFISLSVVASAFLRGLKDVDKMRIFVTQHKAEAWKQVIKTSTTDVVLQARAEDLQPQTVPASAVALTVGIDKQKVGFWFVVRAWAQDYTSWLIHYGYLTSWFALEDLLFNSEYPYAGKPGGLKAWRAGIDIGGGKYDAEISSAEEVYIWLLSNRVGRGCQVWPTKGSSRSLSGKISVGSPLDKMPSGRPIPGGIQVISMDTNKLKDTYHWRLEKAIEKAPQMGAWLHSRTDEDYARQILAEQKERDKRGMELWVQKQRDNHYLDCEVIAHALADPEWPGGGVHLLAPAQQKNAGVPKREDLSDTARRRPDWFNNRTTRR